MPVITWPLTCEIVMIPVEVAVKPPPLTTEFVSEVPIKTETDAGGVSAPVVPDAGFVKERLSEQFEFTE